MQQFVTPVENSFLKQLSSTTLLVVPIQNALRESVTALQSEVRLQRGLVCSRQSTPSVKFCMLYVRVLKSLDDASVANALLDLSLLTMGDGLFSSSGVVMLTGAAASSTSFSLGQDDSLLDIFSYVLVLSTWQVF